MTKALPTLPNLLHRGKVRDTYPLGSDHLLMVVTDRISAFDVVLPTLIPQKGLVLSRLSAFWFRQTAHVTPNHFIALADESEIPVELQVHPLLNSLDENMRKQAMIVKRADRLDVECIVRGYLAGSAWADYIKTGTAFGQSLPKGLQEGDYLREPLFTPTTKAEVGHDEPLSSSELSELVGEDMARQLRDVSIKIYEFARSAALERGIIIADTKMEFGLVNGELILIDELLTPDSSRFWDLAAYKPGEALPNFDKQYVRDWLLTMNWDKEPPGPKLPPQVARQTAQRYREVYARLTGKRLEPFSWRQLLPL